MAIACCADQIVGCVTFVLLLVWPGPIGSTTVFGALDPAVERLQVLKHPKPKMWANHSPWARHRGTVTIVEFSTGKQCQGKKSAYSWAASFEGRIQQASSITLA